MENNDLIALLMLEKTPANVLECLDDVDVLLRMTIVHLGLIANRPDSDLDNLAWCVSRITEILTNDMGSAHKKFLLAKDGELRRRLANTITTQTSMPMLRAFTRLFTRIVDL